MKNQSPVKKNSPKKKNYQIPNRETSRVHSLLAHVFDLIRKKTPAAAVAVAVKKKRSAARGARSQGVCVFFSLYCYLDQEFTSDLVASRQG